MDNNSNNLNSETGGFQYTYSAKEQAELKKIREKYKAPEESKMERLRRLDRGVTQKAQAVALTIGIIGTLILGFGMSLFMTELSKIFGAYAHLASFFGIVLGVIGCILAGLAYPIYNCIVKRERKKIAPEILRLTEELMK